ncbi:hypothetical protein RF11_15295 [Thelohanellus kitauei]|nr:hypothetical protein RF11_15295 [Thelohanellus kitauei]
MCATDGGARLVNCRRSALACVDESDHVNRAPECAWSVVELYVFKRETLSTWFHDASLLRRLCLKLLFFFVVLCVSTHVKTNERIPLQPLTVDPSARSSMKNVAKCDN